MSAGPVVVSLLPHGGPSVGEFRNVWMDGIWLLEPMSAGPVVVSLLPHGGPSVGEFRNVRMDGICYGMRTKDKAKRRVTSVRSLESADECMYSLPFGSENVVAAVKRKIDHVDEADCGSSSVAKKLCISASVTNRKSNEEQLHTFDKESLENFSNAGVFSGARKRKAIEMHEMHESAMPKGQGVSAEPVPALRAPPTNKICAYLELSLFFVPFGICHCFISVKCWSFVIGLLISGYADATEEVQLSPIVNSRNISSSHPTTPVTADKGKRKVYEYNSSNYNSHKEMMDSVAGYLAHDGTQDLLCGPPSSLPMCSRTPIQSHQKNGIPQVIFSAFCVAYFISLVFYYGCLTLILFFAPDASVGRSSNIADDRIRTTFASTPTQACPPSSTTRSPPVHSRSNGSTRLRQEQPTLNRRQCARGASNMRRHRPSNAQAPVRQGPPSAYISMGRCDRVCRHCNAFFWCEERLAASTRLHPEYSKCCNKGQVQLPTHDDYPEYIKHLFNDAHFMEHIRAYNQMFAMTSLGAEVDQSVNRGRGPYVFKISGQLYHCIGGMLPEQGKRPRFLQLYIYDRDNEVDNRLENMQRHGEGLRREIVEGLIEFLDEHNHLVQLFRTAADKMAEADIPTFKVRLFGVVGSRQHELPSGDSIGAIVFEGGPDVESNFDVVIQQHSGTPQRINKLNPSYMSLHFPLLFIYGEDGYHLDLKLRDTTNEASDGARKMSIKMKMDESCSIVVSAEPKGKEVVADSEDTKLATLTVSDTGKSIYVKAYRKWTIANKNGKPVMFCCMLIDRQVLPAETSKEIKIDTSLLAKEEPIHPSPTAVTSQASPAQKTEKQLPATPPESETKVLPESQVKYGPRKMSARRGLYSGETTAVAEKIHKKPKKDQS
ncbi:hypothetical protein CTI12_AA402020 [Artemisia annua]|uniref:Helitron helicase-like domain-containing protein n=1 Tax=Artemisia annua TaxID=35608 RepID=A0A2U1MAD8_ARTAN|nr:hypothetical protein CTI12_AA402020 [Artemisia annua]